jgi:integrase
VFGDPTKGSRLDGEWFRLEFAKAREAAGIEGCVRIHDLRHAALTNLAAKGASPIAVTATAGHRWMQTQSSICTSQARRSRPTRLRWKFGF